MAAAATRSENSGIFWMNGVSDEEQPLAFVPDGEVKSQTPFSVRPGKTSTFSKGGVKMRNRHSTDSKNNVTLKKSGKKQSHFQSEQSGAYTKEKVSVHYSAAGVSEHSLSPPTGTFHPSIQAMSETSTAKSLVCLKDLCPEDKRRIANLIEELARVSEEKEESVQRLKDEQENFERKIQQLEQQNVIIAQERESMQQQYRECQELLGLYQQYLSQQQAKLNQSIAQLSQEQAHSKVLSCEEAPSRVSTSKANGSLFDGSYLSLAATGVRQPQAHRSGGGVRRRAAVQTFSNPASPPCVSEFSPTDGAIKPIRSQRRECREPHSSCEHCQCSGQDSGYGTQQRRRDKCHHDTFNPDEYESANAIHSEVKEALTRPLLGHEDWEEKRHQLLLQKMQLEMEREKLQARLAEQEERLNRQNQQLQQSRLEYSRFRQATQSDLSSSNTGNGEPQPEGPSHQDLTSRVNEDAEEHSAGQNLHEKHSVPAPLDNGNGATERSRKDMAMSPASLSKPTSVSVIQKTPEARLDFSVVELLDIFSPISAPELSKLSTRRPKTLQRRSTLTAPKPLGRALLTPAGPYRQHTKQDLEESQILEDIFFIC
ncbi:protein hinderin isoform X2 [Sparus aurata]|uniref:protein hinderin isoform X2 n=1 Tax=Sparus aurata TaxID=8175 RepID=UPI0011C1254E|nr:protein hinderin isoform X2 [Sparus aurata]